MIKSFINSYFVSISSIPIETMTNKSNFKRCSFNMLNTHLVIPKTTKCRLYNNNIVKINNVSMRLGCIQRSKQERKNTIP